VQYVRRRMVQHRRIAAKTIDFQLHARALRKVAGLAAQDASQVEDRAFRFARVRYFEDRARRRLDHAAIANLSAAFGIKGRLRDDDRHLLSRFARRRRRKYFGLALVAAMADESRHRPAAEAYLGSDRVIFARGSSAFLLFFHQALEARDVNVNRMIAQHVFGQVERESVSVVEFERDLARQRMPAALLDPREFRVDQFESAIERLAEARFLFTYQFSNPPRMLN
jgi:hypothetical protein